MTAHPANAVAQFVGCRIERRKDDGASFNQKRAFVGEAHTQRMTME